MKKNIASLLQMNLVILAFTAGWLGFSYINRVSGEPWNVLRIIIVLVLVVASIILADVISSVFHEIGHLLGGLLSGYSFVYFGCFGFVWIKEHGKLVRKRNNTKGMKGVSRLSPPDMKEDTFPFRLYYFSGTFMNLVLAGICALLFFQAASFFTSWAKVFLVIGLKALMDFIMNLVPINIDGVWNDGYILFNLGKEKNKEIRLKYWRNLRVQGIISGGTRPRELPKTYYEWANIHKKVDDLFTFDAGLIQYKHLMDKGELTQAKKCLQALSNNLDASLSKNQPLLDLELLFHELIGKCREEKIKEFDTKEVSEYVKNAGLNESVRRISYAYARLLYQDNALAQQHLAFFEMACANSVNLGSIPGERELIKLIDQLASSDDQIAPSDDQIASSSDDQIVPSDD